MNRKARRSKHGATRGLKRRALLDFERLEGRVLLSTTYTVNNTSSSGSGSLFDAITQVDLDSTASQAPDIIQFDIPGGGAQTIALTQQLPDITQPTDIQGYTQPGSSANTNLSGMDNNAVLTVIVSGGGNIDNGLVFDTSAAGSSVEGLDLVGIAGNAITVKADGVSVSGNFIGVGTDGVATTSTSNVDGVMVNGASFVTIGGTAASARNDISGNATYGVRTEDSTGLVVADDIIQGNGSDGVLLISSPGASITSSTIGGNGGYGISISGSASATIGGTAAGAGDVVESNVAGGIILETSIFSSSDNAQILDSTISYSGGIGVSVMDTSNVIFLGVTIYSNTGGGVLLSLSSIVSIDSSLAGGPSLIETNGGFGVSIARSTGVTLGGTSLDSGLMVSSNIGPGIVIQRSNATVLANATVSYNSGDGIDVGDTSGGTTDESFLDDSVSLNTGAGISLSNDTDATISNTTVDSNDSFGIGAVKGAAVNMSGSTITGNNGIGLSIFSSIRDSSVTGTTIDQNLSGGILIDDAAGDVVIASSTIGGTTGNLGNGGFGVSISGSFDVEIGDTRDFSTLVANNMGVGISATSTSMGVQHTVVDANQGPGIYLLNSSVPTIQSNFVESNEGEGIDLIGSKSANFDGNIVASNSGAGISLTAGSAATISAATVEQNASFGIGAVGSGLVVATSTIMGNGGVGISIINPTSAPTVSGSAIQANQGGGIVLSGSTLGGTISSSTIGGTTTSEGNGGFGVSVTGSTDVFIGTPGAFSTLIANNTGVGISATNSSFVNFNSSALTLQGVIVQANQGAGITLGLIDYPKIENDLFMGNLGDGIDIIASYGATIQGDIVASNLGAGILLSGDSTAVINHLADISNKSTGLSVVDAAIQLFSATITGNSGLGVSIISPTNGNGLDENLDLQDNTIQSNLGGGLLISGASLGGTIATSTIGGTTADQGNGVFGISLVNSPELVIGAVFGRILVQYNGGDGISVASSNNVQITGSNFIADNSGDGIAYASAPSGTIMGAVIEGNSGSGITLTNGSYGASLKTDAIFDNTGSGVVASGSAGLTVGGTTAASDVLIFGNRGTGLAVSLESDILIDDVAIQSNFNGGIALDDVTGLVTNSSIGGVTADEGNGIFGISVAGSMTVGDQQLVLTNLLVLSNGGNGVVIATSSGVLLSGGQVSGNAGAGVVVSASPFVIIGAAGQSLPVTGNLADGIVIANSPGAVILGTEVGGNSLAGIDVVNSAEVSIGTNVGVLVDYNGGDGIDLSGSPRSLVSNGTSMNNAGAGLNITSPGVTVSASKFLTNAGSGIEVSGAINNLTTSISLYDAGNKGNGILVLGSGGNTIGGAGQSTTIALNGGNGVEILGTDSKYNLLQLSTIRNNGASGVEIEGGASTNVVESDIISGNLQSGVAIDSLATNNYVLANLIGTDLSGANLANGVSGVAITGASLNHIEPNNLIVNGGDGVLIANAIGSDNTIAGNNPSGVKITVRTRVRTTSLAARS